MKYFVVFALLLVIFVVYTTAQGPDPEEPEPEPGTRERCPRSPICRGRRDEGRGGRDCRRSTVWYYDERSGRCREFRYLGCGGNRNRFCTRRACERRCER